MTDSEIRNAAEALLLPTPNYLRLTNELLDDISTIQRLEQQLTSTHNSLCSLEGAQYEEALKGAKRDGRMSVVRRFFCLFVLFDLLLISLTWLICITLLGTDNLIHILKMQIMNYTFTTSLFDVVLAAFCRFTVLLLFYGLLQFNTPFFVASTTLGTCIFLAFKVVYYSWSTASQPVFQVILVLISFVIAWVETWFLDFRVLPQEHFALNCAQSTGRFSESLSTLLLDRNLRGPVMRHYLCNMASDIGDGTESVRNFYSPLESPNDSDDGLDDHRVTGKAPGNEYLRRGKDTLEVAWSILTDRDWKLQKMSPDGDCVYSKHEKHLGRVFLLRTKINVQAQKLLEELFIHVDRFTEWNSTIVESRRVQVIDEHTDVIYQVSSPAQNGVISSRDFVVLRHWDLKGDAYALAGISIPYPSLPPIKNYIRGENGPCCWVMRPSGESCDSCTFEFLLNTNLKGWIPKSLLESSLTSVLLEYSVSLKKHCKSISIRENT